MKKILVVLCAAAVLLAGCSKKEKGASQDLTVLTATFITSRLQAGVQEGYYWTDILKEDLGIALEMVHSTRENLQAAIAARDLPDIVSINTPEFINNIVQGDLMVNHDDYKAKLPNVFANGGAMLQYMRDNVSNGTGRLYFLRTYLSNTGSAHGENNMGPYLRWDYYKELGMPAITEWEDYLPVLKAMVDRHPLTEDGQKVYGVSLWSDWDGGMSMSVAGFLASYYGWISPGGFLEVDLKSSASRSFLDDSSYYKRMLKFIYTANQMGILDPDSITQGWATFLEKGTAGRSLFGWQIYAHGNFDTAEKAAQGIGTRLVPFKNQKPYNYRGPSYVGGQAYMGVSKGTKKLDKALAFLDYYFSWDGTWQLDNGRKGVAWDLDENGEPYLTELGWKIQQGSAEFPNGGRFRDGTYISTQEPAFSLFATHPVYKRRLDRVDWVKKDFAPKDSALDADWKRVMNAEDDLDYFIKNNMLVNPPFAPMPSDVPEDIQTLAKRVGQVVQPASWKMVYARNEAEFNSLWADMVSQAKGIGVDRVNQWYLDAYNAAKAAGSKYMY
jgi:putative aldouronate transport system substrate-binding protein